MHSVGLMLFKLFKQDQAYFSLFIYSVTLFFRSQCNSKVGEIVLTH